MTGKGPKRASCADVEAAPGHLVAEIFGGGLGRRILDACGNTDGFHSGDPTSAAPFKANAFPPASLWSLDRPLGFHEHPQPLYAGDR